jgi:hypothetical protein
MNQLHITPLRHCAIHNGHACTRSCTERNNVHACHPSQRHGTGTTSCRVHAWRKRALLRMAVNRTLQQMRETEDPWKMTQVTSILDDKGRESDPYHPEYEKIAYSAYARGAERPIKRSYKGHHKDMQNNNPNLAESPNCTIFLNTLIYQLDSKELSYSILPNCRLSWTIASESLCFSAIQCFGYLGARSLCCKRVIGCHRLGLNFSSWKWPTPWQPIILYTIGRSYTCVKSPENAFYLRIESKVYMRCPRACVCVRVFVYLHACVPCACMHWENSWTDPWGHNTRNSFSFKARTWHDCFHWAWFHERI